MGGSARSGAGRSEGRTPGWRAKLAPPAGSRTEAGTSLLLGRGRLGVVGWLVGRGKPGATGGEAISESGVLWCPARPHCVEIALCLVELLELPAGDLPRLGRTAQVVAGALHPPGFVEVVVLRLAVLLGGLGHPARKPVARATHRDIGELADDLNGGEQLQHRLVDPHPR